MRRSLWTVGWMVIGGIVALAGGSSLLAQSDEEELLAERARIAKEALVKAVARGKELWSSKEFKNKKTCASCHEDPDKPKLDMVTRKWSYPAYSRRQRRVVTLQQKLNEMIKFQARGKPLEADSTDLAALGAYIKSLKKK